MVICCRCNRTGRCLNCACVKAGISCHNCFPSRLGNCSNLQPQATTSTIKDASDSNKRALSPGLDLSSEHQPHSTHTQLLQAEEAEEAHPLPSFTDTPTPNFQWGDKDGEYLTKKIDHYYEEIVHWKRNLFKVPSGKAGTSFVREVSHMFQAYAESSALEGIAMKAAMILPALILQKPHSRSRTKEHSKHIERRLGLWKEGNLDSLMDEGQTIQTRLTRETRNRNTPTDQLSRKFSTLMMEGKVRAALRLIAENHTGRLLHLDSTADPNNSSESVRDSLLKKHPPKQPYKLDTIVNPNTPVTDPHPIIFEQIDGQLIRSTVLKMDGSAGPSGLDAAAWKRLCTSFKSASSELCDSLAAVARRLSTSFVDPKGLSAFVACRLIALDKCPGVRPIGIGETARRIIGKAIAFTITEDIQNAAGPLQACAGHISGCEAAVHAMRQVYESEQTEAVILVDASNAFNSLNREAALRNIQQLCPSLSKVIINTYREDSQLFIDGSTLHSQEGTTQGDPLAMAMYAIAITPLIYQLEDSGIKQAWYADDATAGGSLKHLKEWWDRIVALGPHYGYHPNATKTWLIVKEDHLEEAKAKFEGSGVSITADGKRHLGAAVGTPHFISGYVQHKVTEWVNEVERLSSIAVTQPHAAYAAFTHGLKHKWTYLIRTIPNIADQLQPLEDAIRHKFIPSLTGQSALSCETRDLMALSVRHGGLGIINPTRNNGYHHQSSENITAPLVSLILDQSHVYHQEAKAQQLSAKKEAVKRRKQSDSAAAIELESKLPDSMKRAMQVSTEKGASSWLATLPIDEHGFALHKGAFRDALCLRYGWRPSHLPSHCICGHNFTVEHALICARGGFPSIRHNELRDITAGFLTEVCHNVGTEPPLQPLTGEQLTLRTANREDGARLDIAADNFWGRDRNRAFFDVRVFSPFAQSHRNTSLGQCYKKNEQEKKRAYDQRIREVEHGSFSPLVFSTSGGMGPTANVVYKRIASMTAKKQDKPYSKIIHWIRCKLSFSLLRSATMCLRGSRSSIHHPAFSTDTMDLACQEGRVPLN